MELYAGNKVFLMENKHRLHSKFEVVCIYRCPNKTISWRSRDINYRVPKSKYSCYYIPTNWNIVNYYNKSAASKQRKIGGKTKLWRWSGWFNIHVGYFYISWTGFFVFLKHWKHLIFRFLCWKKFCAWSHQSTMSE